MSPRLGEDGTRGGEEEGEEEDGQYLRNAFSLDLRSVRWLKLEQNENGEQEQDSRYDGDDCAEDSIKASWGDQVDCFVA